MILSGVKKTIILNAGHFGNDSGAVSGAYVERDLCIAVRNEVAPLLEACGFSVIQVPDNLDLRKSIDYANTKVKAINDGLCLDIHFNSSSDKKAKGTEAYYGDSETSKKIATILSRSVAAAVGTVDRGAKPDTESHAGSLGWIRQTKSWATLVEVGFISNAGDMNLIANSAGYKKAAEGIVRAICEMYGVVFVAPDQKVEEIKHRLDIELPKLEAIYQKLGESIEAYKSLRESL